MNLAQIDNNNGHNGGTAASRNSKHWSRAEKKRLRELYRAGKSDAEIAEAIGRTAIAVQIARSGFGYTKFKKRRRRKVAVRAASRTPRADSTARVTVHAAPAQPVTFSASKATVRAILELLVGV